MQFSDSVWGTLQGLSLQRNTNDEVAEATASTLTDWTIVLEMTCTDM